MHPIRDSKEQPRETITRPGNEKQLDFAIDGRSVSEKTRVSLIDTIVPEQAPSPTTIIVDPETEKSHVSFGVVQIREYPIILGDHPSARFAAPLTIDWDYEEAETVSVAEYDAVREPNHRSKKMSQMRMSPYYRRTLLRELQYSFKEVHKREEEMKKIQRQRSTTRFFTKVSKWEEKLKGGLKEGNCCADAMAVIAMSGAPKKYILSKRTLIQVAPRMIEVEMCPKK